MSISYTADMSIEAEPNIPEGDSMATKLNILGQKPPENPRNRRRREERSKDLKVEWGRQSVILAGRFAKKLDLSTEEYINTLPKFGPKPENLEGTLDVPAIPVIVEARIPLAEMLNIVRIDTFFDPQEIGDWGEGDFEIPKEPYAAWLTYIPNKAVIDVRANLLEGQRGGIPFDGIMLLLTDPRIFNRYSIKFPGSQVGSKYSPFLSALPNPEGPPNHSSLHRGSIDRASPKFACLIASKI